MRGWLRRRSAPAAGIVLVLTLGFAARTPALAGQERQRMSDRFGFVATDLPLPAGYVPDRHDREVAPALERIRGWISSVGAGVALHDLSGDGLPNDACLVDPRIDEATLISLQSPPAYQPFVLTPTTLAFDPRTMAPMGCAPGDFDENGHADVLVYYWGRSPVLFMQHPDGPFGRARFTESELVEPFQVWNTNAVTSADMDGDGHVDLVIGNYFPDGARVLDVRASDDGRMQMQDSMSRAFNAGANRLLLWTEPAGPQAHPSFEVVDGAFPGALATGWTLALGAADLDGDLLPELYIANDFGPDRLLHNRSRPGHVRFEVLEGRRTTTMPASKVLGRDSFKGMGVDFGDLNGDGSRDIFVSNIAADFSLTESHFAFVDTGGAGLMAAGVAPFQDASERLGLARTGWAWDAKFGDFDNSGYQELVQATGFLRGEVNRWPELHELAMGNDTLLRHPALWPRFAEGDDLSGHQHNPFFVRGPAGRFVDLAADLGLDGEHVTRGVATADVDGDGRLDFAWANQWEPSQLFRNRCTGCASFLGLDLFLPLAGSGDRTVVLEGRRGDQVHGRPAIGAQVIVRTTSRVHVMEVDGGNGHSGRRSPEIHVGLGDEALVSIEIRYRDRDGTVRRMTLDLDHGWHTVVLGSDQEPMR